MIVNHPDLAVTTGETEAAHTGKCPVQQYLRFCIRIHATRGSLSTLHSELVSLLFEIRYASFQKYLNGNHKVWASE